MKFKSLKTKLTVDMLLASILTALALGGVIMFQMTNMFSEDAEIMALTTVEKYANEFEQNITSIEDSTAMLATAVGSGFDLQQAEANPAEYLSAYAEEIDPLINSIAENNSYSSSIYVYFNNQEFGVAEDVWYLQNDSGEYERQAVLEMEYYTESDEAALQWFMEPVTTKKAVWSEPYVGSNGLTYASYVIPIIVDDKVVALAGADFLVEDLKTVMEGVDYYETGYISLFTDNYTAIADPTMDMGIQLSESGQSIVDYIESNDNESDFMKGNYDGVNKVIAFDTLSNGWIVLATVPESEVLSKVNSLVFIIIGVGIVVALIAAVVSYFMSKNIVKPITTVTEAVQKMAEGDFTEEVHVNSKDETKRLADGINMMITSVSTLIKNTQAISMDMENSATNLAAMAEETTATADEIDNNMKEISKGAYEQAKDAEEGTIKASNLENMFETLEQSSKKMDQQATSAMDISSHGNQTLDTLREKSDASVAASGRVKDAIERLDEKANTIGEIIETISSIADQTNLLALNASIEAARAGEAGKGFAVVAEEIRTLAENSQVAANQIQEIVFDIQKESKTTVGVMNEVGKITDEQQKAVDQVNNALDEVFESIGGITGQIDQTIRQINELDGVKEEIVESINNISAVTEETGAATESVSVSVAQQHTAIEEVANGATQLNELAEKLVEQINEFTVK
jgi:methyl-accepting chemotaxis protein